MCERERERESGREREREGENVAEGMTHVSVRQDTAPLPVGTCCGPTHLKCDVLSAGFITAYQRHTEEFLFLLLSSANFNRISSEAYQKE